MIFFKQYKTEFSELKQMLAEKWKTKVERIELRLENRDIEPRPSSHGELMPGNSGLNPEKVFFIKIVKAYYLAFHIKLNFNS